MIVRTAAVSLTAVLLVGALAGCSETISGTPGPAPTVSSSGDFPTGSDSPTEDPTDTGTPTDEPTDPPTDEPTGVPSGVPTSVTTTNPDSVETLCANLAYANAQGAYVGADTVKTFVSTIILAWGIANTDEDPYAKADAATTASCPDVRTALLELMGLPDLASTK